MFRYADQYRPNTIWDNLKKENAIIESMKYDSLTKLLTVTNIKLLCNCCLINNLFVFQQY